MLGNWKGFYRFDDKRFQEATGFEATGFEIAIDQFDGKNFSGKVNDDEQTGGMEGTGEIIGKVENNQIYFEKKMPKNCTLYLDGNKRYSEKKHPTLYYSGQLSEDGKKIEGTWKFNKRLAFLLYVIPVIYRPGKGTWNMELKTILLLTGLSLFSCQPKGKDGSASADSNQAVKPKTETPKTQAADGDWQRGFNLTHDIDKDSIWRKPVRYYIENKKCSQTAIDFYYGKYRPTDEPKTEALLGLVTTTDSELRPFYRWVLNNTIAIQDGALAEYTGTPARQYAEKFPDEFFDYTDLDESGDKYRDWCEAISYSGFYDTDDYKDPKAIRDKIQKTMLKNCRDCNKAMTVKITEFANDCFPDVVK